MYWLRGIKMIISEKQIIQLIEFCHAYLNALEELYSFNKKLLSESGVNNKQHMTKLLNQILSQQSEELREFE